MADLLAIELRVRRKDVGQTAKYRAIGNKAYKNLAIDLGIIVEKNNSKNNLRNTLEHLTLVAIS